MVLMGLCIRKRDLYTFGFGGLAIVAGVAGFYLYFNGSSCAEPLLLGMLMASIVSFGIGFMVAIDKIHKRLNNGRPVDDETLTDIIEDIL